jgi:nucleotide-binding universal stress UspA family protein
MWLKDVLVHLDPSKHCRKRLELAVSLARRLDARLEGYYVMPDLQISPFTADQFPPERLMQIQAAAAEVRDRVHRFFDESLDATDIRHDWVETRGEPVELLTGRARVSDLAILGQVDPDEEQTTMPRSLPEEVALASGRALIVVPYAGAFQSLGERVLIAWNASAQAARAVGDALPLLSSAKHVSVLGVGGGNEEWRYGNVPEGELVQYLDRHGIKAEMHRTTAGDAEIGDLILSRAADEAADLIVMGVYGHSRLRELVLGGVSQHIFRHMTVPVFMAH